MGLGCLFVFFNIFDYFVFIESFLYFIRPGVTTCRTISDFIIFLLFFKLSF